MGKHFDALRDYLNCFQNEKMSNGINVKDYISRIVDNVELHDIEYTSPELPRALGMNDQEYDLHIHSFLEETLHKENAFLNTRILGIEDRDSAVIMEPRNIARYFMILCMKDNDSFGIICASVMPLGYDIMIKQFPLAVNRLYDFLSIGRSKLIYPRDNEFKLRVMLDIKNSATAFLEQAAYLEKIISVL